MFHYSGGAIVVSYEQFILNPKDLFYELVEKLDLIVGEKTNSILKEVKCRNKKTVDYMDSVPESIKRELNYIDNILIERSV